MSSHGLSLQTLAVYVHLLAAPSSGISVVAWNCHGLSNSAPYLQTLANSFDIIIVSEHWLWPYELHTL